MGKSIIAWHTGGGGKEPQGGQGFPKILIKINKSSFKNKLLRRTYENPHAFLCS